jgi:hypothetical protein
MVEGFFDLSTPEDLFRKLVDDFDDLESSPFDSRKAFDFFVTATHIADWINDGDRKKTKQFRDANAILKVCDHLACNGKHFRLDNPTHTSVEKAERECYAEPGYVESGYFKESLIVTFSEAEEAEFGIKSEDVVSLASRVIKFWKGYFNA